MSNINNKKSRRAVSPIVAVLILIVVAVVGGGAVAVLMGQIGSDTSKQASSQGTALKSSQSINIGGSTTVFPLTEAIKGNFTAKTNIQVNDAQGGSGAGMIGVDQGVLDIGAASSVKAYNDEVAKDPTANLQAFNIGGSGIVFIEKGTGANGVITAGGTDCTFVQEATLKKLFAAQSYAGAGPYFTPSCAGGELTNSTHMSATPAGAGDVQVFHRSDLPSGTEETAAGWVNQSPSSKDFSTGVATGAVGNPGVFSAVQGAATQALGFVDIGFDKTAAGKATLAIIDARTTLAGPGTGGVGAGASVSGIESSIKAALKGLASNPATPQFPVDNTNGDAQLARTFYYVTKGAPSASEQAFIDFARGSDPTVTDAFTNLGFYSIYSFK